MVLFMQTKKLGKAARKPADNSSGIHSDSFKINTGKSDGNKSVLVAQLSLKRYYFESDQKYAKHISEDAVTGSVIHIIQHRKR